MIAKKFVLALSLVLVLVASLFAQPSPVQAAGLEQAGATRLENLLVRENLALSNQAERLDLARASAAKAQTWIDNLNTQGKDTTALVSGLAAFNQGIVSAQADHDRAAGLLASPAGFDANGKVTDTAAASKTIRDAGMALRHAHLTISLAAVDFRMVVNTYRQANHS